MSRAWTKLINTQLKDVTSDDLAKLSQLMFVDPKAITEFESLQNLVKTAEVLQTPGQSIFADSIAVQTFTINSSSANVKPSTVFDATAHPYADTYLCQLLAVSCTFSDSGANITGAIKDTVAVMRRTSSSSSGQEPLQLYGPELLYFNENNPIVFTEGAGVSTTLEVAVAIVARGGAQ